MSKADKVFIDLCNDIINNGTTNKNQKIRSHWDDGTPAYTMKKFGFVHKYDLREEFPALTLRKTAIISAMDEVLWIYQKKSNNINDLHSGIWDNWVDENNSIGKAYGYQVGKKCIVKDGIKMDQMDYVLEELKNNPFSRRILIDIWNPSELHEMHLEPCCYNIIFNVTDEGKDKLVLNMTLNQRSNDVLVANNWNLVQYSILLMMVAQVSNMIPGVIMHCITDVHIYDRHINIIKELINRETYPAPIVKLNPDIKNFYDFTTKDIIIENYKYGEQVKIPVSI